MEATATEQSYADDDVNGQVMEHVGQLSDLTPGLNRVIERLERRLAKVLMVEPNVVPMDKDSSPDPELVLVASIVRNNNECIRGSISRLDRLIDRISI